MDIVLPLLLQVVLIMLNAIFACAEIAVISTNEAKLNKLISEGNKKAKTLQKLTSNPSKFLSTIQIAITLAGFLGSAFAADNFAGMIVEGLKKTGYVNAGNEEIFNTISVVVITIILSFLTIVFGELIPKRIGMRKSEKIALSLSIPLNIISKLFTPVIWLLTVSINCILKLIGIDPNESDGDEGEEEIRLMVDMSGEKGLIDKEEQEMIQNVFEFDDLIAGEFATHRTDVEILWEEDDIEKWDEIIRNSFHKYYPVCGERADDIIGILNTREYFRLKVATKEEILTKAMQPAYFVPETLKADILFKQMKETNNKFAVVLDEHGGFEGIVTIDDILEQIVGLFDGDKIEEEFGFVEKIDDNTYRLSGLLSVEEINEIFDTNLPTEEYETFSGFVFGKYGTIPSDDEIFDINIENLNIKVEKIDEHVITSMLVTKQ